MHSTDPNPDAPNPAAPPHLPHMHARISAHTTADLHAAKPGVRKNARTSGRTVVPERGTSAACGDAIDSAAPSHRRLPPLAAPRCGKTFGMSRKRPACMSLHIPAQNEHGYMVSQPPGGQGEHREGRGQASARRRGRRGAMRAP